MADEDKKTKSHAQEDEKSVWGLVNILGVTFGLGGDTLKFLPQVKP